MNSYPTEISDFDKGGSPELLGFIPTGKIVKVVPTWTWIVNSPLGSCELLLYFAHILRPYIQHSRRDELRNTFAFVQNPEAHQIRH